MIIQIAKGVPYVFPEDLLRTTLAEIRQHWYSGASFNPNLLMGSFTKIFFERDKLDQRIWLSDPGILYPQLFSMYRDNNTTITVSDGFKNQVSGKIETFFCYRWSNGARGAYHESGVFQEDLMKSLNNDFHHQVNDFVFKTHDIEKLIAGLRVIKDQVDKYYLFRYTSIFLKIHANSEAELHQLIDFLKKYKIS